MARQDCQPYSLMRFRPIKGTRWKPHKGSKYPDHRHYRITGEIDGGARYTIVVNIESRDKDTPELLYFIDRDFKKPIIERMSKAFENHYSIIHPDKKSGLCLDYVHGGLFDRNRLIPEEERTDGEDCLNIILDGYIRRAIKERADMYVFGHEYFNDRLGNGIHDIHMNQGNSEQFEDEDNPSQDGALFIDFKGHWLAMFFCFQSQSFDTDAKTGHRLNR